MGSYEEGLKGRTDTSKKLVKHNQVAREEFTSNKLAPKLAQQLKVHFIPHNSVLPSDLQCLHHSQAMHRRALPLL